LCKVCPARSWRNCCRAIRRSSSYTRGINDRSACWLPSPQFTKSDVMSCSESPSTRVPVNVCRTLSRPFRKVNVIADWPEFQREGIGPLFACRQIEALTNQRFFEQESSLRDSFSSVGQNHKRKIYVVPHPTYLRDRIRMRCRADRRRTIAGWRMEYTSWRN